MFVTIPRWLYDKELVLFKKGRKYQGDDFLFTHRHWNKHSYLNNKIRFRHLGKLKLNPVKVETCDILEKVPPQPNQSRRDPGKFDKKPKRGKITSEDVQSLDMFNLLDKIVEVNLKGDEFSNSLIFSVMAWYVKMHREQAIKSSKKIICALNYQNCRLYARDMQVVKKAIVKNH